MDNSKIGIDAGKVWKTLSDSGELTMTQAKKKATLNDAEINMALGWLAREEKVSFNKKGKATKISLI